MRPEDNPGGEEELTQVNYTEAFKAQMVRKMVGPPGTTATALSKEVGVSQSQLSRWLRQAATFPQMTPNDNDHSPRTWTPEEKLRVLAQAHGLESEALGALLRREGLRDPEGNVLRFGFLEFPPAGLLRFGVILAVAVGWRLLTGG